MLFNPALAEFVRNYGSILDYLAVIPDRGWTDYGAACNPRFAELPLHTAAVEDAAGRLPIVMHSIGLSICSAGVFDEAYLDNLAKWRARFQCLWASDHLSFTRFGAGHEINAALALPIPYDYEILSLLVPRARQSVERLGCPFLLENNVSYVRFPQQEMSEAEFFNGLAGESGCGVLLDLHNVYTNAKNHNFDAREFIASLDLNNVIEIHIAGGDEMMGFHTDSHAGPVLEAVWELLVETAPRLPRLRGVTFEFHESSWPLLHDEGVIAQIERARNTLSQVLAR